MELGDMRISDDPNDKRREAIGLGRDFTKVVFIDRATERHYKMRRDGDGMILERIR